MESVKEVDTRIELLKTEIKNLKIVRESFKKQVLTPAQELAITLHKKLCRHNHTDGCGWYYNVKDGVHNWHGYEHAQYLIKAQKALDCGLNSHTIIDLIDVLN